MENSALQKLFDAQAKHDAAVEAAAHRLGIPPHISIAQLSATLGGADSGPVATVLDLLRAQRLTLVDEYCTTFSALEVEDAIERATLSED